MHDVLGPNLEALDPIRMDYKCHIKYFPYDPDAEGACFEILGNLLDQIKIAARRLRGIIEQQNARQLSRPRWYVVKRCEAVLRDTIQLWPYTVPGIMNDKGASVDTQSGMVPYMTGSSLSISDAEDRERMPEMVTAGKVVTGTTGVYEMMIHNFEAVTMTTLKILTHYRGFLQMRATIGTFVIDKYKKSRGKPQLEYGLDDFDSMLSDANREEGQMEGHLTKE